MARATGIGGLFFRARDPAALGLWYARYFGIPSDGSPWQQDAGPTVFAPFKQTTDYFPADRQHMLNLRVDDLDGLMAMFLADGIAVETRPDWDGDGSYGRFARIHDPEGNPVELWQPPAVQGDPGT
jgi:catechol 2,3-dioxygenase-like lactoylglutathione lyase family enzyme